MSSKVDRDEVLETEAWSSGPPDPQGPPYRRHKIPPPLFFVALLCFALPFVTVTCYGPELPVSGVQAATGIDMPGADHPTERDLRAYQSVNPFAMLGLGATVAGLALSLAKRRRAFVWAAATGVVALVGFYLYAAFASVGGTVLEPGLALAISCLLAVAGVGAWAAIRPAEDPNLSDPWPQAAWAVAGLVVSLGLVASGFASADAFMSSATIFLRVLVVLVIAVALAVGAVGVSEKGPAAVSMGRPQPARLLVAFAAGLLCLAAATTLAIFTWALMTQGVVVHEGHIGPSPETSMAWTILALALIVGGSRLAWVVGSAIARRGRASASA